MLTVRGGWRERGADVRVERERESRRVVGKAEGKRKLRFPVAREGERERESLHVCVCVCVDVYVARACMAYER